MADYQIQYHSRQVQEFVLSLPTTLAARYIVLTRRMVVTGPHLMEPHTKSLGGGLFELRLKGAEGIARVLYCTLIGKRIVMLHGFVKKSSQIPLRELSLAKQRMKEVQYENT